MGIPTTEPASVTAGDTLAWQKTLADYPAGAGWVLSYTLLSPTVRLAITGTASGDTLLINVSAATSGGWLPGDYTWSAVVTKDAERYTVGTGRITVKPNLSTYLSHDGRSIARKMLEAAEAAYLDYLSNRQGHIAEYEIAGRRMKFRNAAEIWMQVEKLRAQVRAEEDAEKIAAGIQPARRLLVRFNQ